MHIRDPGNARHAPIGIERVPIEKNAVSDDLATNAEHSEALDRPTAPRASPGVRDVDSHAQVRARLSVREHTERLFEQQVVSA